MKWIIHGSALLFLLLAFAQDASSQDSLQLVLTMTGEQSADEFSVVAGVGDVNGDGYDDLAVGAPGGNFGKGNYAKLYFGGAQFDTVADLKFMCEQVDSHFGHSIAGRGDVNGDGYPDIVIGAPYWWLGGKPYGITRAGRVYVYFGGPSMDTIPDLTMSPGSWYFNVGWSVAIAGDVNGDGFDDILVGSPDDDIDGSGRAYLYLGGAPMDTIPDAVFPGMNPRDMMGYSVASAGDVNRDVFADFLVGAPQGLQSMHDPVFVGKAYLYLGGADVTNLQYIVFEGDTSAHAQYGVGVAGLGDLNADGFADFGMIAHKYVTIITGAASTADYDTVRFDELSSYGHFVGCASSGDLDGDGFDDICIGVEQSNNAYTGAVLVFKGAEALDTIPAQAILGSVLPSSFGSSISFVGNLTSTRYRFLAIGDYEWGGIYGGHGRVFLYRNPIVDAVKEQQIGSTVPTLWLDNNYPNPFNSQTTIAFRVADPGKATLEVFSILGERVANLVDRFVGAASQTVRFDARSLPSGVYFYRLSTTKGSLHRAMVLLK
jgi:hypothetical protein